MINKCRFEFWLFFYHKVRAATQGGWAPFPRPPLKPPPHKGVDRRKKSLDFEDFCKVAELIKNKAHLTSTEMDEIRKIKA